MNLKKFIIIFLTFITLFQSLPTFSMPPKPLIPATPLSKNNLPPAPPRTQIPPAQRYALFQANQQMQQAFRDMSTAGYNFGSAAATFFSKK